MCDQAQIELYCRANPLLLWVRATRMTQEAPLKFGDVSQEQRKFHRFVLLRNGTMLLGRFSCKEKTHLRGSRSIVVQSGPANGMQSTLAPADVAQSPWSSHP